MTEAQPIGDHYATLGVMPRCEDIVIRAAYLALMHRYHPDKSSSPVSVDRAQAIIAAYRVLGDPEKRMRYDWDRRRAAEELARPPQSRLTRTHRVLIAAAVVPLLLVPLSFMRSPTSVDEPIVRPEAERAEPAVSRPASSMAEVTAKPEPIAVAPPKRDKPVAAPTIAKQAAAPRPPVDKAPPVLARAPRETLAALERPARKPVRTAARPAIANAKCLSARPGADSAVCKNDNLAALDQLGETFYGQSWRVGDAAKRAALQSSRNGLLDRREACRSDSCLRSAYLTHMREISAIAESKPSTPR